MGWEGDHPRSRGVYHLSRRSRRCLEGSSPLARGLPNARIKTNRLRIIPARAGFTWSRVRGSPGARDHPRSRGVYAKKVVVARISVGSSPLARGLRHGKRIVEAPEGIIPARAGFTGTASDITHTLRDHPRSRGVYSMRSHKLKRGTGSSPLARGLRTPRWNRILMTRIIPARAGFTAYRQEE